MVARPEGKNILPEVSPLTAPVFKASGEPPEKIQKVVFSN
jgi:hypothetical protein